MATERNPYLYCHECKDWVDAEKNGDEFTCPCGEMILCDECGQPWTFGLEHEHAIARQKARA